jgi:type IV pilus assembly protein PilB
MGIESYLIAAALNAVLAQRLVRRTCSKCRQVYDPPRTVRKALERMGYEIPEFFRGVGCRHCRNTGFSGRIGIHELLVLNEEMRDAITSQASLQALEELAQRQGMLTLRHDGFRKVREGITTVEEVFHVAGEAREKGT